MPIDNVIIQPGLRIGEKELANIQTSGVDGRVALRQLITTSYGVALNINSDGTLENGCDVRVGAGRTVYVGTGRAMDSLGNIIHIPEDTDLYTIPTSAPYLVLLKYATTTEQTDTARLYYDATASVGLRNKIECTGTEFTSYIRAGHLIKVTGSTGSYNGNYEVVTVVDDTNLIVSEYKDGEVVPTYFTPEESDLTIEVLGDYATSYPVSGNKELYDFSSYAIIIRLEASGYDSTTEIVLARATWNTTGSIQIADLRGRNVLTLLPTSRNGVDEYFMPITPALVRVTTGAVDRLTTIDADSGFTRPGTTIMTVDSAAMALNSYLKVEWGHYSETSSSTFDVGTGRYNTIDPTLAVADYWTTDFWKDAEHYLVDSENVIHKIVGSGINFVQTLTEPASGEFWITPNAEAYEIIVEMLDASGALSGEYFSGTESHSASPVRMAYYTTAVISGQRYRVRVRSRKNSLVSPYAIANPNPIVAGDIGRPDTLPSVSLSHPLAIASDGTDYDYMGIVNLSITNFADCTSGAHPAGAFEIFAKQATSATDFPDTTDEFFIARVTTQNYRLSANNTASSANHMNIRVRPISSTGQYSTPANTWQGTIECGLYGTITEETGGYVGGFSLMALLGMVAGTAGGSTPAGALGATINNLIAQSCCCDSSNSCTTTLSTTETDDLVKSEQHYINFFFKGNSLPDAELFKTELGNRYGIVINQVRVSNSNVGSGVAVLVISGDGGSTPIMLPAGEKEFDNTAFPSVRKSVSGILQVEALTDELRDTRVRLGFKIENFGVYPDAGESVAEHLETLFSWMGEFVEDQELEIEAGVDYVGNFTITDFNFIVQHPPIGGDLVIRIGNEDGGTGEYVDITIPDGETEPATLTAFVSTLEVLDPKKLWARVIGEPYGAGYGELTCRIITNSTLSGVYPYTTSPHFFTKFHEGDFLPGAEMAIRKTGFPIIVAWVEIRLQRVTEEALSFRVRIDDSHYAPYGYIQIDIPAGGQRGDREGTISIPHSQNLVVEMISGTAEYFTVLVEARRNIAT